MMDEIYTHKMTDFLGGDQFHDYVDIEGGEIDNTLATEALLLKVIAINVSWRIPVVYLYGPIRGH